MSTPAYIPNHIAQAIAKLVTPFRNKPRFAAWCACVVNQVQYLENAMLKFSQSFDVDTADEARLILLGKIVGQITPQPTLEQTRKFVKTRILVNRSASTAPDLIKIAQSLLGNVWYSEWGCAIQIEARDPLGDLNGADCAELLRSAKEGGVRLDLIAQNETDGFLFGGDNASAIPDTVHGLAPADLSRGGYLSGVY